MEKIMTSGTHADLVARLEELASKNGCFSAAYENCIEQGAPQADMCLTCAAATAAKALATLTPPADPSDRNTAAEHYRQGWQAGHAAADPPALVALVREAQRLYNANITREADADELKAMMEAYNRAIDAVLAYPLPAAPPVTDTPRGVITTREFDRCSCGHYRCWHLDGRCHWHIHEIVGARVPCGCEQFAPAALPQEDQ